MKAAFLLATGCLAAFGQSNSIQLCDQQATRHCLTLKAPATLPANVVCTTGTTDLGSCSGSAPANMLTTDTNQTGISGQKSWTVSGSVNAIAVHGNSTSTPVLYTNNTGAGYGFNDASTAGSLFNKVTTTDLVVSGFTTVSQSILATAGVDIGSSSIQFGTGYFTDVQVNNRVLPITDNVGTVGNSTHRFNKLWVTDLDFSGTLTGTVPNVLTTNTNQSSISGQKSWTVSGSVNAIAVNGNSTLTPVLYTNNTGTGYGFNDASAAGSLFNKVSTATLAVSGFTTVSQSILATSAVDIGSSSVQFGTGYFTDVQVNNRVLPATDNVGTVGNATHRFNKLWVTDLDFSGTLTGTVPNVLTTNTNQSGISGQKAWTVSGSVNAIALNGNSTSTPVLYVSNAGAGYGFNDASTAGSLFVKVSTTTLAVSGFTTVSQSILATSAVDIGSSSVQFGTGYFTDVQVNNRVLPATNNVGTVGNSTHRFNKLWVTDLDFSGTITGGLVTSLLAGSGISISGSTGAVTVTATGGGGSGTVTSVATAGPITGGTFTTSGTIGCATCLTTDTNQSSLTGQKSWTVSGSVNAIAVNGNSTVTPVLYTNNAGTGYGFNDASAAGSLFNKVSTTTLAVSGFTTVSQSILTTAAVDIGSSSVQFGTGYFTDVQVNNRVLPATNNVGTVGNSTHRFNKLWVQDLDFSGTISGTVPACAICLTTAGGQTISGSDTFAAGVAITGGSVGLDIQVAAAVQYLTSTTGTNRVFQRYNNTAGNLYVGIESSGGSSLLAGAPAYAAIVGIDSGRSLVFGTSNVGRLEIDAAGLVTAKNGVAITGGGVGLDIQVAAAVQYLTSTTTTNRVYQRYQNGAGNLYVGIESSGGSSLLFGAPAYAGVVGIDSGRSLIFGTSNLPRVEINAAGLATFYNGLTVSGGSTTLGALTVSSCSGCGGTGTVTSIATSGPITGGPITSTGTIGCVTCLTTDTSQSGLTGQKSWTVSGSVNAIAVNGNSTFTPVLYTNNAGTGYGFNDASAAGSLFNKVTTTSLTVTGFTTVSQAILTTAGVDIGSSAVQFGTGYFTDVQVNNRVLPANNGVGSVGTSTRYFGNVYANTYNANGNTGTTQVVTVRNSANTGACVLIFSGGIFVGSSC